MVFTCPRFSKFIRTRGCSGEIDRQWIGENIPWQAVQHAERIMNFRDQFGETRIIDVHYADLMRELYASLGDAFSSEAEANMREWLADNPQRKFGRHEYNLAEYGRSADEILPKFERYLSRYHVEREG